MAAEDQCLVRPTILSAIDDATVAYDTCWLILSALKRNDMTGLTAESLLDFQPTLASALFKLDDRYRELAQERELAIASKAEMESASFLLIMRQISSCQAALVETMELGRTLGDAFAWSFYVQSQEILSKHYSEIRNAHTPPGLGGRGELEFLKSVRSSTHFILYHGITNFLRVGDISFVKLSSFKVTCIGELKTEKISETSVVVTAHVVSASSGELPKIFHRSDIVMESTPKSRGKQLSEQAWRTRQSVRLKRQLNKMAETIDKKRSQVVLTVNERNYVGELSNFMDSIGARTYSYVKLGPGLIVAVLRVNSDAKFSDRYSRTNVTAEVIKSAETLPNNALQILNTTRENNRLEVGSIDGQITFGIMPLFWWHLDLEFIKEVYFHKCLLITLYNSVYFVDCLRENGFTVEEENTSSGIRLHVSMSDGVVVGQIENFDFFTRLVTRQLMKEDTVARLLKQFHLAVPKEHGMRALFDIAHFF